MSSIHSAIDTYQINMALAHGSSRLVALARLRAVLRNDRQATRPYRLWEQMKAAVERGVEIPKHPMEPMAYLPLRGEPSTVRGGIVRTLFDPMRMVP